MKVLIYNKATDQYRYVHFGKPPCSVLRLFTRGFFPGISTDLSAYILCFCDIGSLASLLGVSWWMNKLARHPRVWYRMGQRKLGISTADARDGLHFRGQKSRQHTPTRRGRKIGEKKKYGSGGRRNIGFDLEYGDGGYKDDQDWYTYVKLRYQLRQSWNSIHRRLTGRGCRSTMASLNPPVPLSVRARASAEMEGYLLHQLSEALNRSLRQPLPNSMYTAACTKAHSLSPSSSSIPSSLSSSPSSPIDTPAPRLPSIAGFLLSTHSDSLSRPSSSSSSSEAAVHACLFPLLWEKLRNLLSPASLQTTSSARVSSHSFVSLSLSLPLSDIITPHLAHSLNVHDGQYTAYYSGGDSDSSSGDNVTKHSSAKSSPVYAERLAAAFSASPRASWEQERVEWASLNRVEAFHLCYGMPLLDITSIIRHTIRDFPISFTVTLKFRTVSTASPSPVPALAAAVPSFGLLIPITGKAGTKQLCVSSANHNVYTLCGGRFSSSSSATIDNHILMTVYFDVRISTDTREESLSPSPTSSPPSASEPTLKICSTTIARIDAEYALDKMYRKSARFGHDNNSSAGSRRNVEVRKSVCNLDNQEDSRRRLRYLQQKYNMFKQADNWLDFMFKLQ